MTKKYHRILEVLDGNKDTFFYPEWKIGFITLEWKRYANFRGEADVQKFKTFNEANEWLCKEICSENKNVVAKTRVHKANPVFSKLTAKAKNNTGEDVKEDPVTGPKW